MHHFLNISFRPLTKADGAAYRALRTEALRSPESRFFTTNIQEELSRSLEEWGSVCDETCERATMGAFHEGCLVGTISVLKHDQTSAHYVAGYVKPAFRGSQIPKTIFEMMDEWAVKQGCTKAIMTIHTENTRWLLHQCEHGAFIVGKDRAVFADGKEAPLYVLERPLPPHAADAAQAFPLSRPSSQAAPLAL